MVLVWPSAHIHVHNAIMVVIVRFNMTASSHGNSMNGMAPNTSPNMKAIVCFILLLSGMHRNVGTIVLLVRSSIGVLDMVHNLVVMVLNVGLGIVVC